MAWYVYVYRDPTRNNVPIYVGKGKGKGVRAWAHLKPTSNIGYVVKRCRDAGIRLEPEVVGYFEDEEDAYACETRLILQHGFSANGTGTLMNRVNGRLLKPKEWSTPCIEGVWPVERRKRRRPNKHQRARRDAFV